MIPLLVKLMLYVEFILVLALVIITMTDKQCDKMQYKDKKGAWIEDDFKALLKYALIVEAIIWVTFFYWNFRSILRLFWHFGKSSSSQYICLSISLIARVAGLGLDGCFTYLAPINLSQKNSRQKFDQKKQRRFIIVAIISLINI